MPKLGDVARAKDIGLGNGSHKAIWHACADCKKERWVLIRRGKPQSRRCHPCGARHRAKDRASWKRGPQHPRWKDGRSVTTGGYIKIWLAPSDPLYPMAHKDGYIFEHRLIMARHLGKVLDRSEEVHHKNRDKKDNRIENLELLSKKDHSSTLKEVNRLTKRIKELEIENEQLREELKQQHKT